VPFLSPDELSHFITTYGYWAVLAVVALESIGVPVPGETTLIVAAVYAGTTAELNILFVIAAAAAGGIVGDNIGFCLGRKCGYPLLLRYGRYIGFTDKRIKLGQYLFQRHGGKVVFFGRFVAVLRALAALLAGANCMSWPRFLMFNAAGAILWATVYGLAAYYLGEEVHRVSGPVGTAAVALALIAIGAVIFVLRRNEARWEDEAERALPGPLRPARRRS
jgi:membrane protein DedA with SNARE-associated domain